MDTALRDQHGITGDLTFSNFVIDSPRALEIDTILRTAHDLPNLLWESYMQELRTLCSVRTVQRQNLVVLAGRSVLARLLTGDTTYSGTVNYGALGTSNTAVNANDIQLTAEVARKLFARRTRTGAVANFDFFYSKADTSGTYQEFGLFIDGTASANTGQLFNHLLTGGWTKTSSEAMTVSVQININP